MFSELNSTLDDPFFLIRLTTEQFHRTHTLTLCYRDMHIYYTKLLKIKSLKYKYVKLYMSIIIIFTFQDIKHNFRSKNYQSAHIGR